MVILNKTFGILFKGYTPNDKRVYTLWGWGSIGHTIQCRSHPCGNLANTLEGSRVGRETESEAVLSKILRDKRDQIVYTTKGRVPHNISYVHILVNI